MLGLFPDTTQCAGSLFQNDPINLQAERGCALFPLLGKSLERDDDSFVCYSTIPTTQNGGFTATWSLSASPSEQVTEEYEHQLLPNVVIPEIEKISPTPTPVYSARNSAERQSSLTKQRSRSSQRNSYICTPKEASKFLVMEQRLEAELAAEEEEENFVALQPVTHLWNNRLFVGGYPDNEALKELRSLGITHIINCCSNDYSASSELKEEFSVTEFNPADTRGFPILVHFYPAFSSTLNAILADSNAKIFVHCIAGINRSPVLCAAFLMEHLHLNPVEVAHIFRENGRRHVLQNASFRGQLVDFFFHLSLERK